MNHVGIKEDDTPHSTKILQTHATLPTTIPTHQTNVLNTELNQIHRKTKVTRLNSIDGGVNRFDP